MTTRFFKGGGLPVPRGYYTKIQQDVDPGDVTPDAPLTLQIWYDAATNYYMQPTNRTNGERITQWDDRSSYAHNLNPISGGTDVRPTYLVNQQNGLSALSFDGTDVLTANPFTGTVDTITGMSMFVVCKFAATTTQRLSETNATGDSELGFGISANSGQRYSYYVANGYVVSTVADTAWHVHSIIYDGSQSVGNRLSVYIDGSPVAITEVTPVGNISLNNNTALYVG